MTAPPRRAEVTKPARHGAEFSTGIAFNIRNLPRCVMPLCFTRSYSERCVRRRVFGKENEPADAILSGILYRTPLDLKISRFKSTLRAVGAGCATSVQKKSSTGIRGKTSRKKSRQFIARATQQVIPVCQLAIQWWQLELRLQRDLSQWLQAQWWEPEFPQE
jgi:hypothetical protein